MATMAKWSGKTGVVNTKKALALDGLSITYDTKEKVTDGPEPIALSCTTLLHSGAGVDVRDEIVSWRSILNQKSYFWLNSVPIKNKNNKSAMFRLRKVSVSNVKLDDFGRMRLATLSLEFIEVTPSSSTDSSKVSSNASVHKATTQTIKVGSYVRPTGKKYATGETIPQWVKDCSHKVSQIKGNKILLGYPDGIRSWVYKDEVTLV